MFDAAKHPRDLRGEFRRTEMALHVASRVQAGGGNVRPDLADSPGRSSHGRLRNYGAMTDGKLIGVLTGLTQYGKDPEAVKAAQAEAARRTGTKLPGDKAHVGDVITRAEQLTKGDHLTSDENGSFGGAHLIVRNVNADGTVEAHAFFRSHKDANRHTFPASMMFTGQLKLDSRPKSGPLKKLSEVKMDAMDRRAERRLEEFGLPHLGSGMFNEQLHPRQHGKFSPSFHHDMPTHHRWVESNDKSDAGIEELRAHAHAMDAKHGTTHEFHDPRVGGHKYGASVKFHGSRAQLEAVGHSTRKHYVTSSHSPRISDIEKHQDAREATFKAAARQRLAKKGRALPDGSFPIESVGDLTNAVQAFGRSKNKARAKAHIVKRAKALGATGKLPHGWLKEAELLDEVEAEMIAEAAVAMDAELQEFLERLHPRGGDGKWIEKPGSQGAPDQYHFVVGGQTVGVVSKHPGVDVVAAWKYGPKTPRYTARYDGQGIGDGAWRTPFAAKRAIERAHQDKKRSAEAADSMVKASTPEPFSKSKTSNWVARGGGLPNYIQHVAHGLVRSGHSTSEAIQMAIGIVKRWARGGGKVDSNTQAAAAKAVGEWEALKAKNAAKKAA